MRETPLAVQAQPVPVATSIVQPQPVLGETTSAGIDFSQWQQVLGAFALENPVVAGSWRGAKWIGMQEGKVTVAFPSHLPWGDTLATPRALAELQKYLAGVAGRTISVSVIKMPAEQLQDKRSIQDLEQAGRQAKERAAEQEMLSDPLVKTLVETFSLKLESIELKEDSHGG